MFLRTSYAWQFCISVPCVCEELKTSHTLSHSNESFWCLGSREVGHYCEEQGNLSFPEAGSIPITSIIEHF